MSPISGRRAGRTNTLEALLQSLVDADEVTAAAAVVGTAGSPPREAAAGVRRAGSRVAPTCASLFDLASLSKLWSVTLALRLAADGRLPLATDLGDIWPRLRGGLARLTLEALLRHRGGFRPWFPLYARRLGAGALLAPEFRGLRRPEYSDLGFMVWGRSVEEALRTPLAALLRRDLLSPLGLIRDIRTAPADRRRVVECRLANGRERSLAGELGIAIGSRRPRPGRVQDGNADWLGGFPAHAGLFGSARAMWRLAAEWVAPALLPGAAVKGALAGDGHLRLGWWAAGDGTYWHPGFTGGSVALDPRTGRIEVLLAHRRTASVPVSRLRAGLREVR